MSSASLPLPWRLFPLPERLVRSPLSLLCLALLVNALVLPYLGVYHDARLYAFYLESRLEPSQGFDHDLYLAYGSQDRFSLYSAVMLPLVKLVGLQPGLFIVYSLSKALLFWAFIRLVGRLTRDDFLTAVVVLFLAVSPIPFGGNGVFNVNEAFLTPRLCAAALAVLGLERMLAGKYLAPAVLLLGGLLLHPLMGVGGLLTAGLWWVFGRLNWWQLLALALAAVGVAVGVLAYEPLGTRLFGHMDDTWRTTNLQICFFIKPREWFLEDWARIAWDCLLVVAGATTFARHCGRFLWAVLTAGLIGLGWSVVGLETHYLLLIQTSPYRTLWVLELVSIPLAFLAVADLWRRGTAVARSASLALLFYVTDERAFGQLSLVLILLIAVAFLVCVVWRRGLGRQPADPDWLLPCSRQTFLIACGIQVVFSALVLWFLTTAPADADQPMHPVALLRTLGPVSSRLVCLLAACQAAALLVATLGASVRFRAALLTTAAVYLAVTNYVVTVPWYAERFVPEERHTAFVANFLNQRREPDGPAPCVYWNTDMARIWFGLRANSYVTIYQMAGCAFHRETASEGKRRIRLVARFEADADRRSSNPPPPRWQKFFEDFRDGPPDAEPATRADLLRLAHEEMLDYAVLSVALDDLYSATDGHYYIYDCKRLRALAEAADAPPSAALAEAGR